MNEIGIKILSDYEKDEISKLFWRKFVYILYANKPSRYSYNHLCKYKEKKFLFMFASKGIEIIFKKVFFSTYCFFFQWNLNIIIITSIQDIEPSDSILTICYECIIKTFFFRMFFLFYSHLTTSLWLFFISYWLYPELFSTTHAGFLHRRYRIIINEGNINVFCVKLHLVAVAIL